MEEQIMTRRELRRMTFDWFNMTNYIEEEYQIHIYGKILTYHNYKDYEEVMMGFYEDGEIKNVEFYRYSTFAFTKILIIAYVETK